MLPDPSSESAPAVISVPQSEATYEVPYRLLIEQIPGITYVASFDAPIKTLYVSPQVEQILGYPPADFIHLGWPHAIHAADRDRVLAEVTRAGEQGVGFSIEYRVITASGDARWVLDEARVAHDERGLPTHVHGVMMDITQRKEAEQRLAESEHKFRLLAENATDIIFRLELEPSLHYSYISPAVSTWLGYSPQEFYDDFRLAEKVVNPDDLAWLRRGFLGAAEDRAVIFRALHRNGHDVWLELRHVPVRDHSGRVIAHEGIMRDVTARTYAEQRLAEASQTMRTLIDNAPVAIVQVDTDFNIILWNPMAEKMFGWTEQEVLGKPLPMMPAQRQGLVYETMVSVLEGTHLTNWEAHPVTSSGRRLDVVVSAACIRDSAGQPAGLVVMYADDTARIAAERDLRRSEELYRTLVESLQDSVTVRDRDGRYVLVNSECALRLGQSREELVGKTNGDVHDPEAAHKADEDDAMVLATGQMIDTVMEFSGRERAPRCQVRKTPLKSPTGEVVGVVTISRDITQQERAAKAARDSEQRFKSIFDNTAVGVILTDPTGVIVAANGAMGKFMGYAPDELIGMNGFALAVRYPDAAERVRRGIADGTLNEVSFEGPFRRKDGSSGWGAVVASVKRNEMGLAEFLVVVVEDMTERHDFEVALKEATSTLEATINSSPVAILSLDREMVVKVWNPAAERLFGWTAAELVGKILPSALRDPDREAPLWHNLVRSGIPASNVELRRHRRDGSAVEVSLSISPVLDETGSVTGVVGMYSDITERKRAEIVLKKSLSALRESMEGTIHAMAEMTELRDPYTAGHQRRVSEIAVAIATRMGLSADEIECIRLAGLVHDIGKIGIPSEILTRPGKLGELELTLAKMHPQAGYDMLKSIRFPWPIAEVVLQHHERMDGSGYPRGLVGNEIMVAARVLAAADVLEAMSSHRPYRPALGFPAALQEIQSGRGVLYDAAVVDACDEILLSPIASSPWQG
ncbi:MAG TPA: PAS domain S-box protein [Chloroflexota bacterium]